MLTARMPRPHRLFLAALAGAALAACGRARPDPGPLRHVVLISLDTTRADHLGCYGGRVATPAIDALAAGGVRFADVTAPAPTTLASHTSLMTGSWPHTHGVVRNGFVVHDANVTLAELLRDAGFHTAAVLGSFALESRFGFDQGFAHFDERFDVLIDARGVDQNQRRGDRVTAAALAHLDAVGDGLEDGNGRVFLFVHYFDAHHPYAPPAPFDAAYTADGQPAASEPGELELAVRDQQQRVAGMAFGHAAVIGRGFVAEARGLVGSAGQPTARDRRMADLYAGELAFVDRAVGELLAGLRARGLLDQTLVVLTGDHGETFWEHFDFWNHGLWVHQTTVGVPLVMRFPDGRWAGTTVDAPVSTVDVLPTLCELLGLELPERAEGVSLVPLMKGLPFERGPVFSEATQPYRAERPGEWGNALKPHAVRRGPWKYVRSRYNRVEQLFHLGRDPGETTDLLAGGADAEALAARADLAAQLDGFEAAARPLPSHLDLSQQEDTLRRLRELGYAGDEGDPPEPPQDPPSGDGHRR